MLGTLAELQGNIPRKQLVFHWECHKAGNELINVHLLLLNTAGWVALSLS